MWVREAWEGGRRPTDLADRTPEGRRPGAYTDLLCAVFLLFILCPIVLSHFVYFFTIFRTYLPHFIFYETYVVFYKTFRAFYRTSVGFYGTFIEFYGIFVKFCEIPIEFYGSFLEHYRTTIDFYKTPVVSLSAFPAIFIKLSGKYFPY
jgi:hypothetical protein